MDDLLGQVPDAPKKAKKQTAQSDGSTMRVEEAFKEAHRVVWQCEAFRHGVPRERAIIKKLVEQLGEDDVLHLIAQFFSSKRRRGDYTMVDFERQVPALRLEQRRTPTDQRTFENIEAAMRAAAPRAR